MPECTTPLLRVLVAMPTFYNVQNLLVACTQDEQAILQAKHLGFELELPDAKYVGFGDREMISQALRNLLGNAIKFAKSRVAVSGRILEHPAGAGPAQRLLEFAVTDDGPGVPAEDRAAIFEKFATSDRNTGGNGLGLFIARKVADLHEGTVSVDAAPRGGSTFRLRLPQVFDVSSFPDMTDIAEARIHVISPQKTAAQILESVLVEGGMVNVSASVANRVDPDQRGAPGRELTIVDLQHPDFNLVSLIRAMQGVRAAAAWMLLGRPEDFKSVDQLVTRSYYRLEAPLNPLRLLHQVHEAVQIQERGRQALRAQDKANLSR